MRPEEPSCSSSNVRCILCKREDETKITGPLACEKGTAAHQNCLLYSSGLFCKYSPTFDDLFGFDVEDVETERRRGRKLKCDKCKHSGATAGCEVKSCRRSYHYPCAKEARAKCVEDEKNGTYKLYCVNHNLHAKNVDSEEEDDDVTPSTSGHVRSETNEQDSSHLGSESDADTPLTRRSKNRKRKRQDSYSDSDESQSIIDPTFAPLESEPEDTPPNQNRQQTLDSDERSRNNKEPRQEVAPNGSDEDDRESDFESQSLLQPEYRQENVPFTVIADSVPSIESVAENSPDPMYPPTPSPADTAVGNLDQSVSAPEQGAAPHSNITVPPNPPVPAYPSPDSPPSGTTGESSKDKGASCGDLSAKAECCVSQDIPNLQMTDESQETHLKLPHDNPLDLTAPVVCSTARVQVGEPVGHVGMSDSGAALFWRRCNEVGYTEAIFTELTRQLTTLAERVQNQHATQQDYAVSLRILEASGKLPAIFKQMEQDLEEQERQLQQKREALRDAKAVLDESQFT